MSSPVSTPNFPPDRNSLEGRWLACAAHMAHAGRQAALPLYGTAAGRRSKGRGAGGDTTIEIDTACETAMRTVLAAQAPAAYRLVSEEAGLSGPADAPWKVVLDPLDGSLNAKRGLEPFCASIAVADGPLLRDVRVAYVEDYVRGHIFAAGTGTGLLRPMVRSFGDEGAAETADATAPTVSAGLPVVPSGHPAVPADLSAVPADLPSALSGHPSVPAAVDPERFLSEVVEVVFLEVGRPDNHRFCWRELGILGTSETLKDMRVRQIGSLALSLCYVASGIGDVLVAAVRSRAVDVAAGLLILRKAGGTAVTLTGDDPLLQPLDLERREGFIAWRRGLDGESMLARAKHLGGLLGGH